VKTLIHSYLLQAIDTHLVAPNFMQIPIAPLLSRHSEAQTESSRRHVGHVEHVHEHERKAFGRPGSTTTDAHGTSLPFGALNAREKVKPVTESSSSITPTQNIFVWCQQWEASSFRHHPRAQHSVQCTFFGRNRTWFTTATLVKHAA